MSDHTSIIWLTKNKYTIVDSEDYDHLSAYKWYVSTPGGGSKCLYAVRSGGIRMHRLLMSPGKKEVVDHINRNSLDNRKSNLRVCSHHHNCNNAPIRSNNVSGFKGVYWWNYRQRYKVEIRFKTKPVHIGTFKDKVEAAKAYDEAAIKYFGEFALTNKMMGLY